MSKDAYYFSHDSNARNDVRMIKLRRMGGLESVGLFWCTIEMLREADNYELPTETIDDICYEFRCDVAKFELLFICDLLTQGDSVFYSNSLKTRMARLDEIKEIRAIAGKKGGEAKRKKPIGKQLVSNKSKVNKSKVKESKEDDSIELTLPFNSEKFIEFWNYWKEYKKTEHRFNYKSVISEQSAAKELAELSNGDESTALKIIERSMAKGWKGFFPLDKKGKVESEMDAYKAELKRRAAQ